MNIFDLLKAGELRLNNRLEAEVLLAFLLQKDRGFLYAWPHLVLDPYLCQQFWGQVERRLKGEPIAYIVGEKEFWSLPLKVTPAVLIPRPETECLVEAILNLYPEASEGPKFRNPPLRVLELGTGSGAIALALAHERPSWEIIASDISETALAIAEHNKAQLQIENVTFYLGDWFKALDPLRSEEKIFDVIVSNPPYIDANDIHLNQADLRYEPQLALISRNHGLGDLQKIISESPHYLSSEACLIVEHGYDQKDSVAHLLKEQKMLKITSILDQFNRPRLTLGSKP